MPIFKRMNYTVKGTEDHKSVHNNMIEIIRDIYLHTEFNLNSIKNELKKVR